MTKISTLALLTAMWAFAAPSYAEDASVSAEASASAEVRSGEVGAPDDGGVDFDIDVSLGIDITVENTVEIRRIVVEQGVQPIEVDFDVAIGSAIPATVSLSPLPIQIVQVIPGFEGFWFFILADGGIIIVSPATLKVVLIIYA